MTEEEKRTGQQRKSIELYCKMVAKALDEAGESVQTVFTAPIQITQENVKEHMFKVVMKALFPEKKSTTELNTKQVNQVYENMHRIIAERYGVNVEFPSEQSLYNEAMGRFSK